MSTATDQTVRRSELPVFFNAVNTRMQREGGNWGSGESGAMVNQDELDKFFGDIGSRMGRYGTQDRVGQEVLKRFFVAIDRRATVADARQRRIDQRLATGFNVFDLIEPDENKLSDILADLLDPEGSHGQGDLFLTLLFEKLGYGSAPVLARRAVVRREAPTHGIEKYRRRMDILVQGGVLVAIENKVDSVEQKDQVKDYLEHLRRCTVGSPAQWALIYLTPKARPPDSLAAEVLEQQKAKGRLHCWSYQVELRSWLEECRKQCAARKIQDFLSDFMSYIESTIKREPEISTEEDDNEQ